jgi:outer membrane lipoprotein-sorting protein
MIVRRCSVLVGLCLLGVFLSGCPKKVVKMPLPERLPYENPMFKLLQVFSPAETVQARASIRIEAVRKGQQTNLLLNGTILYQRPDKLRISGFHPLGMGLFDALYVGGGLFILSPLQKRAYTGQVTQFEGLFERAGVQVSALKSEGEEIPNRIRIFIAEKEISVQLSLKGVTLNAALPEDSFEWNLPAGVEVRPLTQLLKVQSPG